MKTDNVISVRSTNTQFDYESTTALNTMFSYEYDSDHYIDAMTEMCDKTIKKYGITMDRALHIGCATGRLTFTIATGFKEVCISTKNTFREYTSSKLIDIFESLLLSI